MFWLYRAVEHGVARSVARTHRAQGGSKFLKLVILAAAWWYEHVVSYVSAISFDWFYVPIRKRYGHDRAWCVATFIEMELLPCLLGGWLVWPIAGAYLRDKWRAELDEQNRR